MKITYVTHVNTMSTYGAASSLRNHILSLSNDIFDYTVLSMSLFNPTDDKNILLLYSPNYKFFTGGFIKKTFYYLRNLFLNIYYKFYSFPLNFIDSDILHFNSLVLLPNLKFVNVADKKIVFHVREILSERVLVDMDLFDKIDHFICIDLSTYRSLIDIYPTNQVSIIENPILINNEINSSFSRYIKISQNKIVFSIVGVITEDKGIEFVIDNFISIGNVDSVLFIVGSIENRYASRLIKKYFSFKNIFFLGEVQNLANSGYYNLVDYLIRGEDVPCVGRTTLEALYAGCSVILPGVNSDYSELESSSSNFLNHILTYSPRVSNSFCDTFRYSIKLYNDKNNCFDNNLKNKDTNAVIDNFCSYKNKVLTVYENI